MSVKIRPYRKGGWEVDIHVVTPDGKRSLRERRRGKMSARSAVMRWAEGRERVLFERLLNPALDIPKKEVPTLQAFAPRFIEGHAIANRLKPSSIAAKNAILRLYLIPMFGRRRLDAIKSEDVQRLKAQLELKSPKTVNNVLNALSVLLKRAVEWEVIDRMPCTVKLLRVQHGTAAFHDFDAYERLVEVARSIDIRTLLVVLLGGDAGLRCGEIIGLEWGDVDLVKRQLCEHAFAPFSPTLGGRFGRHLGPSALPQAPAVRRDDMDVDVPTAFPIATDFHAHLRLLLR